MRVRFRVDGVVSRLHHRAAPHGPGRRLAHQDHGRPRHLREARRPQDGRIGLIVDGRHVDLRVVTLPLVHGESVVMRILDKDSRDHRPRRRSGMAERRAPALRARRSAQLTAPCSSPARPARARPPRSTRRCSELNTPEKTLITIEDPVEYQLEGIKQVQVNPKVGPDLRHRPALDDARRPRHHHGRRDPRPRDGADRRGGRAHRPPRALHAAHQRRADGGQRA